MWVKLAARTALPALLLTTVSPVRAESILDRCAAETCKARLTSEQLLEEIQELIAAKRYNEVKPLLAAIATVPALRFESRFLTGYVAEQTVPGPDPSFDDVAIDIDDFAARCRTFYD